MGYNRDMRRFSLWHLFALTTIAALCALGYRLYDDRRNSSEDFEGLPWKTTLSAPVLTPSSEPVALIYTRRIMTADRLEAAVWSDGKIIWRSGRDALVGHIEPAILDDLMQQLHREGVFGDGKTNLTNVILDAPSEIIEIRLTDRQLHLESCHDLFKSNPNVVDTARGIVVLEGRDRDSVLASQPRSYLRFRRIWSDIRSTVRSWIPAESQRYNGPIPIERCMSREMAELLISGRRLDDNTRAEVVDSLGEPRRNSRFGDNDFAYPLDVETSWTKEPSEWFLVRFDQDERVSEYQIVTD